MGIGFIVTIVVLAVVLGLFSKQALSSEQGNSQVEITSEPSLEGVGLDGPQVESQPGVSNRDHSHAM